MLPARPPPGFRKRAREARKGRTGAHTKPSKKEKKSAPKCPECKKRTMTGTEVCESPECRAVLAFCERPECSYRGYHCCYDDQPYCVHNNPETRGISHKRHKFTADPVEGQESDDSDDGRAAVDVVADYADLKPKDELANLTQRLQRSQTQKSKPCPQDEKDRQEKAALVKKWRTVLDRQSAVKQEAEITLLIIPLREPSNASILLNQAVLESANARTLRHFGFQFNKEKRVFSCAWTRSQEFLLDILTSWTWCEKVLVNGEEVPLSALRNIHSSADSEVQQEPQQAHSSAQARPAQPLPQQSNNCCGNPACPLPPDPFRQLHQCTRCRQVQYCNTDCQRADWKAHKRTCRRINEQ